MKPHIDKTSFGVIIIEGVEYDNDVVIRLDGSVVKRKKKLSKNVTGSAHTMSLDEAEFVYETGAKHAVIGTGQSGRLHLSDEAAAFFKSRGCTLDVYPTPWAVNKWNSNAGPCIGLFHVTC